MSKPLVGVVIGTRADFNVMQRGLESLRVMGIPYCFEMASPHRNPDRLVRFAQSAGEEGIEVLICAAGGSANVAGMLTAYTTLPVIAVPVDASPLRGQDALLSMVQQPPGVPVATVGINSAENAVLLAAQILALKYPRFRGVLAHQRAVHRQRLESARHDLLTAFPDLVAIEKTSAPNPSGGTDTDADTDPGAEARRESGDTGDNVVRIHPGALYIRREPFATPSEEEAAYAPQEVPPPESAMPDMFANQVPPGAADTQPDRRSPSGPVKIDEHFVDTKVFKLEHDNPDEDVLSHAMLVLLEGGIVAFPTDTVYGLAVDASNPVAVRHLYDIKGQDAARKSLAVLIHSPDLLDTLVTDVPPAIESVIGKFWPGGLTILFNRHPSILNDVSPATSLSIRIPNDPIPLRLMEMLQRPLAVITASMHPNAPVSDPGQVVERFDGKIHCVLDAGPSRAGKGSTVLSVLVEPYEVLREGTVSKEELKQLLGNRLKT